MKLQLESDLMNMVNSAIFPSFNSTNSMLRKQPWIKPNLLIFNSQNPLRAESLFQDSVSPFGLSRELESTGTVEQAMLDNSLSTNVLRRDYVENREEKMKRNRKSGVKWMPINQNDVRMFHYLYCIFNFFLIFTISVGHFTRVGSVEC